MVCFYFLYYLILLFICLRITKRCIYKHAFGSDRGAYQMWNHSNWFEGTEHFFNCSIPRYIRIYSYIIFFWKNYFHFAFCVLHFFGIEGFEVKPHKNRTVWVIRRRLVPTEAQNKKGLSSRVSLRDRIRNGLITCSS